MKQILYVLVSVLLLINTSCKKNSMDVMHDNEVTVRNKYIKDHNLAEFLDPLTGIYFKSIVKSVDTTLIRTGFKVKLQYDIFLIDDSTKVFTTQDDNGYTFDEDVFYIDLSTASSSSSYVQKIAGLNLGLKKMHIGDRAFMVIPSELAFKAVDYSVIGIPRFSTLLVYVYAKKGYAPNTY